MVVLATVFFVVAAGVAFLAAPAAALVFWLLFPATWPAELPKYQPLFAALVALFAAGLASFGVALTIWNRRQIFDKQLAAQRLEQDRSRSLAKQQIASAFVGEIEVIIAELKDPALRLPLEQALYEVENRPLGPNQCVAVSIGKKLSRYYESNPANAGLFPGRVCEALTKFYSTIEEIKFDLDLYCDHGVTVGSEKLHLSNNQLRDLLRKILSKINICLKSGSSIAENLKLIRDAAPL